MASNTKALWLSRLASDNYKIEQEENVYGDIDYDFFDSESQSQLISDENPKFTGSLREIIPTNLIIPTKDITNAIDFSDKKVTKRNKGMPKASNLMNCIAYSSPNGTAKLKTTDYNLHSKTTRPSSTDFDSLSSDTTSEITNVTSRATSSECTLRTEQRHKSNTHRSPRKQHKKLDKNAEEDSRLPDAVNTLMTRDYGSDISKTSSSLTSVSSSAGRRNPTNRKNMSFSNSELREIDRDNRLLLQKIQGTKNTSLKPSVVPPNFNLSSSAINRRNHQEKIDLENHRIARRLQSIKSTTDTSSPWIFSRRK